MLRRLRLRRSMWAAIAVGILSAPAMFGGVAAAPAEASDLLPPPDVDPRETLPPDPIDAETRQILNQMNAIADLAPEEFRHLVVSTANQYSVDPRLIAAIITVESEWDPAVVGSYGELGLMQILPSTGTWLTGLANLKEYDLADPATSVMLGTMYIHYLLKEHANTQAALAVYNGGPRAAATASTNRYANKVMRLYQNRPGLLVTLLDRAA
ncbi:MAG TPA: lytic transglycosylase domain-containing protein [Symbiobacteriaceae bacterium]|nr:lytic transglycosylase domain-containing protein [Symbiobacteriaceae bacterium]